MHVDVYADPSCPFSWVTARWVQAAVGGSEHTMAMRPLSLGIVNEGNDGVPAVYAEQQRHGRRLLRAMEAVRPLAGDDAVTALYFAAGRRFHVDGDTAFDCLPEVFAAAGLDGPALAAADDVAADAPLHAALDRLRGLLGDGVGSPALVVPSTGRAFAGPLLSSAPAPEVAVRLLDAVLTLAAVPEFSQVKAPLGDLVVA